MKLPLQTSVKTGARLFRASLYLLLMVIVALAGTVLTMRLAIHGAEVMVPDVGGLTLADAHARAISAHLALETDGRYYSDDVPPGHVLTQMPAAGTVVRKGWRIRVAESLGPRKVPIPELLGQPERISSIRIRRLGLELGAVAHLPYPSGAPDTVLSQNPSASSTEISRPRVSILIADAPPAAEKSYVMPDFTGRSLDAAREAIERAGLRLAPPLNPAPVQDPAAIAAAAPNGVAGPASSAVPANSATSTTQMQGPPPASQTTVSAAFAPSTEPEGTVVAQSPAAGSRIDPSIAIRLTVSQ